MRSIVISVFCGVSTTRLHANTWSWGRWGFFYDWLRIMALIGRSWLVHILLKQQWLRGLIATTTTTGAPSQLIYYMSPCFPEGKTRSIRKVIYLTLCIAIFRRPVRIPII
ncbi:hypothetical protein F4815DRAFT_234780 [Daldinia loculata]|nr:hypothetical protein F4815DRAFT_234780 [Daldinia loculata]